MARITIEGGRSVPPKTDEKQWDGFPGIVIESMQTRPVQRAPYPTAKRQRPFSRLPFNRINQPHIGIDWESIKSKTQGKCNE